MTNTWWCYICSSFCLLLPRHSQRQSWPLTLSRLSSWLTLCGVCSVRHGGAVRGELCAAPGGGSGSSREAAAAEGDQVSGTLRLYNVYILTDSLPSQSLILSEVGLHIFFLEDWTSEEQTSWPNSHRLWKEHGATLWILYIEYTLHHVYSCDFK